MRLLKKAVQSTLKPFGVQIRAINDDPPITYPETTPRMIELVDRFRPYTMTGRNRQWNLLRAAMYVEQNGIAGDIVECGVWRGGNMMMLKSFFGPETDRRFFLYDTFSGMTEPTDADVHFWGAKARTEYDEKKRDGYTDWAYASLPDVKRNFEKYGLAGDNIFFVQGKVEETLPAGPIPDRISLLRLDTDWYESTKCELDILYPRLESGGVLIIDDYGDWLGAKKAVDEYFGDRQPLFIPVDHGLRMAVKP